jgi:hypothetical protein
MTSAWQPDRSDRDSCSPLPLKLPTAFVTTGNSLGRVIAMVRKFQVAFDCAEPERVARF